MEKTCQYCDGSGVAPDGDYCQWCGGNGFIEIEEPAEPAPVDARDINLDDFTF